MAKQVIGAEVSVEFQSVGNLRKAIKEANSELLKTQQAFGVTSKEAIEAAKRVNDLKDAMKDANEVADLFDPGNRFKAVGNAVNALAGGFAAVQGALGLLGVESKEVEKQLLKVQSALALSQGLSTVIDSGKDFARLGAIIKNQVVTAFSTLRGAIISTGIGALVVALGALIANFDKIKNAIDGVSDAQKDIVDQTTKAADKEAEKLETLDSQDNVLRLQGKSETQILEIKRKQVGEIIEARQQQLKAAKELRQQQIEGAKRNKEILQGILNFITAPLRILQSVGGKVAGFLGLDNIESVFQRLNVASLEANNRISEYFFNIEDATAETDTKIKEVEKDLKDLEDRQASIVLNQRKIAADAKKQRDDEAKKLAEERERLRKELAEQKVKDLQAEADAEARWIEEQSKIIADREAEREKENEEANARAFKRQQEYVDGQLKLQEEYKIAQIKTEEEIAKAKMDAAFTAISIVKQLAGQNRAIQMAALVAEKGLAIANVLVNAGKEKAANASFAALNPLNALTGGAAGLAQLTKLNLLTKIRTGINIATITSAGLQGARSLSSAGGAGSGGVPSLSTGAPLQANLSPTAQAQALNNNAINNLTSQPTRAYILDRDIRNQNQINSFINRNSRI